MSNVEVTIGASDRFKQVPLGEIVEVIGGKPAPQKAECFADDGIPFVRMKDLGKYHKTDDLQDVTDFISRDFVKEKRWNPVKAGAILMPRSGSVALNHRAILGRDALIVSHICALQVTSSEICNRYLYRYLCSVRLDRITKRTTGLDAINFSDLKKLSIPVPPLEEQRRIAAILDKADAIRRKRQEALRLADEFLRSAFLEMFGDPANNSKALPTKPLSWFGEIVTGNTPPRFDPKNYGSHIEWIKSDNINTPEHFITEATEYLSEEGAKIGRVVAPGSILVICIAGSPASIGKAALADRDVALNQQINAITPNPYVDQHFLYAQFVVGQKLIQEASTNSMKGMVSKGKFKQIHFLAPDLAEQRKFGEVFRKYLNKISRMKSAYKESQGLFGSLSQLAFRGEL